MPTKIRVKVNGKLFIVPVRPTAADIRRCVRANGDQNVKYCETWKLKSGSKIPTWKRLADDEALPIFGLTEFIVGDPTESKKKGCTYFETPDTRGFACTR